MQVWFFLMGYVCIRISGAGPERLVNLCLAHGISLRQLTWRGETVEALISRRDFLQLRPLVRRAGVRVRVLTRLGLPFILRGPRRRRLTLALALLTVVFFYLFSMFIWFVDITGPFVHVSAAEIQQVVTDLGLKPGTFRPTVDRSELARQVMLRLPALAWAHISFQGTRAIVEVVERTLPPPAAVLGPGHILARRPGIIEEVLVLSGEAKVTVGATVTAGDLLISGLLTAPAPSDVMPVPGADEPPPERFAWHQAKGRILARTWYEDYLEIPLTEEYQVRTGSLAVQYELSLGDRKFMLYGTVKPPFAAYEIVLDNHGLPPDRHLPAVQIIKREFHEVTVHRRRLTVAQARREAEKMLRSRILGEIPIQARIINVRSNVVQTGDNFVGVHLRVECLEDIGQFQPWTEAEQQQPLDKDDLDEVPAHRRPVS